MKSFTAKITRHIFFLFLCLWLVNPVNGQITAQWRGPGRSGIYNETGLLKKWPEQGPGLLWHFDGLGKGYSSPVIASDKIFITGMINGTGTLFCLDLSGKLIWKTEYGPEWTESYEGTRTTPTFVDGKLFLHSGYGLAICVNAADGKILWSVDLQKQFDARIPKWGIAESPLVTGDKVIFSAGGSKFNIVALNINDGKTTWTSEGKGDKSAYCSPHQVTHNGKNIILTITADNILGINPDNGNMIWSYPKTNTWSVHPNTPLYHEGMLYCVSGYGSGGIMLKLSDDGTKVTEVWTNTTLDNQMGGVILMNGNIYGSGQKDVSWQCLDWKTGAVKQKSKEIAKGTVIAAGGMLYAYTEKGEVVLINPVESGFEIVSKFKIDIGLEQHWAHMVINKGVLFVRHGNALIAYDVRDIKN